MSDRVCVVKNQHVCPKGHSANVPEESSCLSRHDFEVFVREYSDRLLGVATRILRSPEDAADALQDGLLSAYKSRHLFRGQSTVYTWLYRVVTNACLMSVRARQARKHRHIEMSRSNDERPLDFPDTTIGSPSHRVEAQEARSVIHTKINLLPDDYRTILLLRDVEELDTSETAQRLCLSREAVKTRVFRARQALRNLLEPCLRAENGVNIP